MNEKMGKLKEKVISLKDVCVVNIVDSFEEVPQDKELQKIRAKKAEIEKSYESKSKEKQTLNRKTNHSS